MKSIIIMALLVTVSCITYAQHDTPPTIDTVTPPAIGITPQPEAAVTAPVFPGGIPGFQKFLTNHLQYPTEARENDIQGRVIVRFKVCTDGSLCDFSVISKSDSFLAQEALRVTRLMPNWQPARDEKGQPTDFYFTQPIDFRLTE